MKQNLNFMGEWYSCPERSLAQGICRDWSSSPDAALSCLSCMNLTCSTWFGKTLPLPVTQWPSSTVALDFVLRRFVWVCFLASHTKYCWVFFCSVSVSVQLKHCTTPWLCLCLLPAYWARWVYWHLKRGACMSCLLLFALWLVSSRHCSCPCLSLCVFTNQSWPWFKRRS